MKLIQALAPAFSVEFREKGYALPKYDRAALKAKTYEEPTWLHFGAGNIFRAYQASILEKALNEGAYDRGVIVAESFDYELIDSTYAPFDNLTLSVVLKADGSVEKNVIGAITESLKADLSFTEDWARLSEIFRKLSLQMVSFSITEKGYVFNNADLARGFGAVFAMGKLTALLYERFKAGAYPLTLQSMDNCSHNGDKVKAGVLAYAKKWCEEGLVPPEFYAYVSESGKITYPWAMIDKIVPRPDAKVRKILEADGFEDAGTIETSKHSFTAPFVNGEETGYLIIEDDYPNGKLPLELGGAVYTSREIVDKMERMKVCTCLNPLHTAVATAGCLLGYTLISDEMKDDDLRTYITRMVYEEAMPVVTDPGIVSPAEFADTVLTKRLPNPFMPDTPQRIVVDNSQKIPVRFGETIKNYIKEGLDLNRLNLVSFALASYARYLRGIDDEGRAFEPSPDPLLSELMPIVAGLEVKEGEQDFSCLKALYCRPEIFGVNLYDTVLGDKVEAIVKKLYAGPGAVRKILHEMVTS